LQLTTKNTTTCLKTPTVKTIIKKEDAKMLVPTLIMGVLAIILIFIGYLKGEGEHIRGIGISLDMLIQILPLLIFAFIVAGMI